MNAGAIENQHVNASAAIAATKMEHQHRAMYEQESDTTAAAETRVVHVVKGTTGTMKSIKVGSVVACIGAATMTVDMLVNGVTKLTGTIELDNADVAYIPIAGTIGNDALVADDVMAGVQRASGEQEGGVAGKRVHTIHRVELVGDHRQIGNDAIGAGQVEGGIVYVLVW